MQLHITNRQWCDFVVWTQGRLDKMGNPETKEGFIVITRIYKSAETLEKWNKMKSKLENFFREDLAPEIVDSRVDRNMKIRQPLYRVEAGKRLLAKKAEKGQGEPTKTRKGKSARKLLFEDELPAKKARED